LSPLGAAGLLVGSFFFGNRSSDDLVDPTAIDGAMFDQRVRQCRDDMTMLAEQLACLWRRKRPSA
jgi:hypothetical protein